MHAHTVLPCMQGLAEAMDRAAGKPGSKDASVYLEPDSDLPLSIQANREPYWQGEWRKQPYSARYDEALICCLCAAECHCCWHIFLQVLQPCGQAVQGALAHCCCPASQYTINSLMQGCSGPVCPSLNKAPIWLVTCGARPLDHDKLVSHSSRSQQCTACRPYQRLSAYALKESKAQLTWKMQTAKRGACSGQHCGSLTALGSYR